jgi:hypothetical protein
VRSGPDFLIIGAMKSGTSSLYRNLVEHPEVNPAVTKEVHYFTKHFDRGPDWYGSQFPPGPGRISGEATPTYMFHRGALDRMAAAAPNAKLIAILRNPVDRAWSHYRMRHSGGTETRGFREIVEHAPSTAATDDASDNYVRWGEYADALDQVVSRFPREQLLVQLFDDLTLCPAELYDSTCAFLGIATGVRPRYLTTAVTAHAEYRSVTVRRLLKKRGPAWFRKAVSRLNVTHPPPAPMEPDLRAALVEHFRPHNRRLEAWLGRDLSHWDV